jgi:cobalt-precorrin 5A hydrolase / precorrin-3B C17-methyltransferase
MTAIVALTQTGADLARRLAPHLPGAQTHGLAARASGLDRDFTDTIAHLRSLFARGEPIIGICAAGILVRALAPLLADKSSEPPVVAVAEDGSVAIPLLGGHRGANDLARAIAAAIGATAAITTAGDIALGVALDQPPPGWTIADRAALKPITAALLARQPVALHVDAGDAAWLQKLDFTKSAPLSIRVTDRSLSGDASTLVYHPPVLALGVGTERDADPAELDQLVRDTLATHHLSPHAIACIASIDLKIDESAVQALTQRLGVPARFFTAEELAREEKRLATPSEIVRHATGTPGVAEAAALAAAGADASLIVAKTKSPRTTCAIARAPRDIDPLAVGHGRGSLAIVGIGPGMRGWRSPEVADTLESASDIVGYGLYLDLITDAIAGKTRHETGLGDEEGRARRALDLAASGRHVALVSSGDAGIYGLAALAFELLERADNPAWARVELRVCPGISALQAAAARAGAPLGHDFCAISLSDLLTPWPDIERRLAAAADADFVTALYNPASQRRREHLARAHAIFSAHRPPDTPVIVARNLGRSDERVEIVRLADLNVGAVDMLTLVLIGSTTTRRVDAAGRVWVYTPRGYSAKIKELPQRTQRTAEKKR